MAKKNLFRTIGMILKMMRNAKKQVRNVPTWPKSKNMT